LKKLILIISIFVSTNVLCSDELQIADFPEVNAWHDAQSVLASSQYYLIELVSFGQSWVPYINEVECWKKKYTFKAIFLADGIAGY
jgi:hypothetical protein